MEVERPRDDQPKVVDIDRLAIEIISAKRDRPKRAFACAMARCDDHFGVGLQRENLGECGEAFAGAVGVRRQAEVKRHHRRLVQAEQVDRLRPACGGDDAIAFIGPFQLALEALVILDDQQDGEYFVIGHARFRD